MTSSHRLAIFVLFFLSGFSALVYEILWARMLTLTFGSTIYAISVVAAVFMGGLALGSYLFGFVVDRSKNLLRIYAALEVGIAIFALLFPPSLKQATEIHIWLERLMPSLYASDTVLHLLIAATLLLPPTVLMGGTFPAMCRLFVQKQRSGEIGRLYATNTFGATLGALGCGFILLPAIGHTWTNLVAVTLNLVIALCCYGLSSQIGTIRQQSEAPKKMFQSWRQQHLRVRFFMPVLLAIATIGGLSLAYEILWTRVFLLFLGNTSYAFAIILGVYLLALAAGGGLAAFLIVRACNIWCLFAMITTLMGASVAATLPYYDQLAHAFLELHRLVDSSWTQLTLGSLGLVAITIGLPTMLSGALLPIAVNLLSNETSNTGEKVGLVVLFNTLGAVIGSLLAGFVLIPLFGTQNAFAFLALVNIVLGVVLLAINFKAADHPIIVSLTALVGILCLNFSSVWDARLMNSGVYVYAQMYLQSGGLHPELSNEKLIDVIEGTETTVAVYENEEAHTRYFTVNGKTDGGTGNDMATQLLVGHLPMLIHPQPDEVMVIGLGTGISLNGLSSYPTGVIDCAEISPEVVTAAQYFVDHNGNALNDPKINLMVEDGRNLLHMSEKRYDVIISEPSNPWQTGNANLFTREFFELASQRLKPGGIFTQWVGMYDITPDNLRIVVRTLLEEFHHVMAFRAKTDLILVASQKPFGFNYQQIAERLSSDDISRVLKPTEIDSPGDIMARYYMFNENVLRPFCEGAPLNTDRHPILEYSARNLLQEKVPGAYQMANIRALMEYNDKPTLPLHQLGDTKRQKEDAFLKLADDFEEHGRFGVARQFKNMATRL